MAWRHSWGGKGKQYYPFVVVIIWYHPALLGLQQHGFNAVMLLLELVLSRTPVSLVMSGYMALWLSAFSVWSTFFFWRTGRWVAGGGVGGQAVHPALKRSDSALYILAYNELLG